LLLEELAAVWPIDRPAAGRRLLGSIPGSGLQAPSKVKVQVDRQLTDLTAWTWHDLRRSLRSGLARLGIDADTAQPALNRLPHISAMERVYNRHSYTDEILVALERWQDHVALILDASQKGALDRKTARA